MGDLEPHFILLAIRCDLSLLWRLHRDLLIRLLTLQGSNLLYMDPHETQPCAPLPASTHTYFCDTVRLMPITSMDPSLAIGFHCRSLGEIRLILLVLL